MGLVNTLPPKWVDIVEEIHEDFTNARETSTSIIHSPPLFVFCTRRRRVIFFPLLSHLFLLLLSIFALLPLIAVSKLQDLHSKRLQVTFSEDESDQQEREIDMTTRQATSTLKSAENKIKRIAMIGNEQPEQLTDEERILRVNVMRNLGTELQGISKSFRNMQKEFLMKVKGQAQVGSDFFQEVTDSKSSSETFESALDNGFSEEQMAQLKELEQRSDEREKEIIHLVQSVNELATLFQELSLLVIEQGTILDRIDYNIANALDQVDMGVQELTKADDYSKRTLTLKCIIVLVILIIIEIIVLVSKNKK